MSTETPNPQPRDRVRVVIDGVYERPGTYDTWVDHVIVNEFGVHLSVPRGATVEVLERADDPTQDPIWTVREVEPKPPAAMSNTVVKFGDSYWLYSSKLGNGYGRLDWATVRESKVIGVVPGTPAAEAQMPLRHVGPECGCDDPDVVRCRAPRPQVRVPSEPHGLPIPVRQQAADRLVAGDVPGAVAAVVSGGLTRDQADRYVRDMEEWQTYLNHHGEKRERAAEVTDAATVRLWHAEELERVKREADDVRRVQLAEALRAATDLPWKDLLVEARTLTDRAYGNPEVV